MEDGGFSHEDDHGKLDVHQTLCIYLSLLLPLRLLLLLLLLLFFFL